MYYALKILTNTIRTVKDFIFIDKIWYSKAYSKLLDPLVQ